MKDFDFGAVGESGLADRSSQLSELLSWLADASSQRYLLAVGSIVFAVQSLFLAVIPRVDGFENYIIAAYPSEFWFLFAIGLTTAILVFVGATISYSRNWRYAFVLLAVNYGVFFLLPAHRGYALYDRGSADALGHLGIVKEILQTNALPEVIYPAEHLLMSLLAMHDVSLALARYLLEFGFTLLFIGSVGILVRELVGDERGLPAGLAAATPLVFMDFQVRIHPAVLSVMLFPLVVFLIERNRHIDTSRIRLGYVALALTVVFFHPVTTGLLAILVASTVMFQHIYDRYLTDNDPLSAGTEIAPKLQTRLAGILLVVSLAWYSNFARTQAALDKLGGGPGQHPTIVASQAQLAGKAGLSLPVLALRFVQKYGTLAVYAGVATLFGLLVFKKLRKRRVKYVDAYVSLQLLIGIGLALLFLNVYLLEFDPTRVSRYLAVAAVLAIGVALVRTATARDGVHYAVVAVLTVTIIVAAVLGTFAGTTYWPNKHMTQAEYEGAEFALDRHDTEHRIRTASLTTKTQWYVTGSRKRPNEPPAFRPAAAGFGLPPALGYDENETAGRTFGESTYLITHAYDIQFDESAYYTEEQQRELGVYERRHVQLLDRDATVNKVYANGGFKFWQVTAGA